MKITSQKSKLPWKFNLLKNMIATVFMAIFLSGCGNWVLRADFDNYSPNISNSANLEGSIKGNPEGDSIELNCPTGDLAILSGNPNELRIDNCFEFIFIPADHSPPPGYKIDWVGRRDFASGTGLTFITFIDDSNPTGGFFLAFQSGTLKIIRKVNQDVLAEVNVSDSSTHSIRLEMNMDDNAMIQFWFQEKFGDGTSGPQMRRSFDLPSFKKITGIRIDTEQNAAYTLSDLDVFATN